MTKKNSVVKQKERIRTVQKAATRITKKYGPLVDQALADQIVAQAERLQNEREVGKLKEQFESLLQQLDRLVFTLNYDQLPHYIDWQQMPPSEKQKYYYNEWHLRGDVITKLLGARISPTLVVMLTKEELQVLIEKIAELSAQYIVERRSKYLKLQSIDL